MSFQSALDQPTLANPLDILEEIVSANEWLFDRTNDDELIVELSGRWCHYRMFFVWQKEIGALQFSCQFDMKVPEQKRNDVHDLLAMLNDRMWLGHFNIDMHQNTPLLLLANGKSDVAHPLQRLQRHQNRKTPHDWPSPVHQLPCEFLPH